MEIVCEHSGDAVVVRLTGALDVNSGAELRRAQALLEPAADTVLDLTDIQRLDSAGLGAVVAVHLAFERAGRKIVLVAGSQGIGKILYVAAIDKIVPVMDSVEEAIEALGQGKPT
jgi:anti-anti-sigma factor